MRRWRETDSEEGRGGGERVKKKEEEVERRKRQESIEINHEETTTDRNRPRFTQKRKSGYETLNSRRELKTSGSIPFVSKILTL